MRKHNNNNNNINNNINNNNNNQDFRLAINRKEERQVIQFCTKRKENKR